MNRFETPGQYASFIHLLSGELYPWDANPSGFRLGDLTFNLIDETTLDQRLRAGSINPAHNGVLCAYLRADIRRALERRHISYVTGDGMAVLFLAQGTVKVRPRSAVPPGRVQIPEVPHYSSIAVATNPTTIVSPAGLAILDAVFRMDRAELEGTSGLSFAKKYGLWQSRISRMSTALAAKDLWDLRRKAANLGVSWWTEALSYKRTTQRMTPFSRRVKYYKFIDRELTRKEASTWRDTVLARYSGAVYPGPTEAAKLAGLMSGSIIELWCMPEAARSIKKEHRLVPSELLDGPAVGLASLSDSFEVNSILSKVRDRGDFGLPESVLPLNQFRIVWDLGFGDQRARTVQAEYLERLFDAA